MVAYDDIIQLFSIFTTLREPFNHHGKHVAGVAMKLAKALDLPTPDVGLIGVGANLHDIGKLLIRVDLVNAPRKLSEAERTEMQAHVTLGWAVVNEAGYSPVVCDAVRHHHERMDGNGYPDGLRGEQIPLVARIVAICDCYMAMTSPRPYRDAYSHEFAMAFIQQGKGTAFDAGLVDVFFEKVKPNG